jgi:hypothetical protein
MATPERNISARPSSGARQPSALDERLASLDDEATHLRAEVAALQDEIRWLTGEGEEPPGWLARGWVRASLLLTAVGMVALVSLPYLLHLDASGPHADPTPRASARPAPVAPRATVEPAPAKAAAREALPAPARVRAPEVPEPARVHEPTRIHSVDDRSGAAPRPRPARERRAVQPSDAVVAAPARGESP